MAGVVTGSGTFTTLQTNLVPLQENQANGQLIALNINPNDLLTIVPEIWQTINMFQKFWGAQVGANINLDYWATAALLQKFLTAYINQGVTRPPTTPIG